MPQNCCVPLCSSVKGGHRFPSQDHSPERRKRWLNAISRLDDAGKKAWVPSKYSRVCGDHFLPDDYVNTLLGERKTLKKEAVPSVFSFKRPEPSCKSERRERFRKRTSAMMSQVQAKRCKEEQDTGSCTDAFVTDISEMEEEVKNAVDSEDSRAAHGDHEEIDRAYVNKGTECRLITGKINFTIDSFRDRPDIISYYTGFKNYDHFMLLFNVLGECVFHLDVRNCHLHPRDQLFLTLIKLRTAKDDIELGILFDLSRITVSHLTLTWIKFLYFQLKEIKINPSKEVIQETMPNGFKKQFPTTRMIIDGTEVPIQKPSKVDVQSCTFSTYKNKNTLKVLVGCTPRGMVSYISDAYGGSVSDRQICERSELIHDHSLFDRGDSIMADRGFTVQDLFATKDVAVNMPCFLKGKSQLNADQVIRDRRIASKRIHVERVIGLAKTYKILKKEIPLQRVQLGSYIISVCFYLANFKPSIVSKYV